MRITKTEERWFDVPNDPDGGRLKIKHLTPGEEAKNLELVFSQEITYKKTKNKTGKKDKFEPIMTQKANPARLVRLNNIMAVTGWEKFYDENGKPLEECNEKNVIRAYDTIEGFDGLISELREQLADDLKKEREDQAKNLSSSASEPAN